MTDKTLHLEASAFEWPFIGGRLDGIEGGIDELLDLSAQKYADLGRQIDMNSKHYGRLVAALREEMKQHQTEIVVIRSSAQRAYSRYSPGRYNSNG